MLYTLITYNLFNVLSNTHISIDIFMVHVCNQLTNLHAYIKHEDDIKIMRTCFFFFYIPFWILPNSKQHGFSYHNLISLCLLNVLILTKPTYWTLCQTRTRMRILLFCWNHLGWSTPIVRRWIEVETFYKSIYVRWKNKIN